MQRVDTFHSSAVECHDQIARLDPGAAGRSATFSRLDADRTRVSELEMPGDAPREGNVGAGDAEVAAPHLAIAQELHHDPLDGVDRGGEADALRHGNDRGVDA